MLICLPTQNQRDKEVIAQRRFRLLRVVAMVVLLFRTVACVQDSQLDTDAAGESSMAAESRERSEGLSERTESRESTESDEEGGEEHSAEEGVGDHDEDSDEGEESRVYIARADTWDATRGGARLVLSYNAQRDAFVGWVENTTDHTLCGVRVEVHLDGGAELGPTPPTDVPAGETTPIELANRGASFEAWTAHPELSACSNR